MQDTPRPPATLLDSLDLRDQAIVLTRLFCWCTEAAHSLLADEPPGQRLAGLIAVNELEHTLAGQVRSLLVGDPRRYPNDVLVSVLEERARKGGLHADFERQLREAVASVGRIEPGQLG